MHIKDLLELRKVSHKYWQEYEALDKTIKINDSLTVRVHINIEDIDDVTDGVKIKTYVSPPHQYSALSSVELKAMAVIKEQMDAWAGAEGEYPS